MNNQLVRVDFHGASMVAVTIDGVPHVALRPIVDALGVDWKSQHARIQRHPVLRTCVVVTTTQIPGDDQRREIVTLPLDKLDGWLFGINSNRVKPELRPRLIDYQRECFDVLARHFGRVAAVPAIETDAETTDASSLLRFSFHSRQVRVLIDDRGEPLFVGKDVCTALGYSDAKGAIKRCCKGVPKHHPCQTRTGIQELRVFVESDVLRLIVGSRLPAAVEFEQWLYGEVLPAIRKTPARGVAAAPEAARKAEPETDVMAALTMVPVAVRAARVLGLDEKAAAVGANRVVERITGVNVLDLLGHTPRASAMSPEPVEESFWAQSGIRERYLDFGGRAG